MPLAPQPPSLTQIVVVSCGWSDDETSVQRVSQIIGPSDSGTGNVAAPLVARGNTNLAVGGATILNYYNDLTVWTGLDLLGGSATAKTMVRNIVTDPLPTGDGRIPPNSSPACNNPPAHYECSTQKSTLGHDVVSGDTNLSGQTAAGFFQYLFGKDPVAYRDSTASWIVDPAGTLANRNTTSIDSIRNMTDRTIWIEGNVNGTMPSGAQTVIGARNKPVLLIINGDLDLSSFNGEINGMVFVTGNVTGGGSPTIYGSMVVGGNASLTGNLKIVYDPGTLSSVPKIGKAAKLPGTWRDW